MSSAATTREVVWGDFVVERTYPAAPSRVFKAFSDLESKRQWFGDPNAKDYTMDFRVGGVERNVGEHEGTVYSYISTFMDIVTDERIITSYEMYMNDDRISVSVAAMEFFADGEGTRFVISERGVYLDGLDNNAQRHEGTGQLMDALGAALAEGKI